jgi:tetratricopeptide (TPR) repeat protein
MRRARDGGIIAGLLIAGSVWAGTLSIGLAQVPTEADVYVDRGIIAYDAKRYAEALQSFQEALRINPNSINAHYYIGLSYMALEQYPEAQAAMERARDLAPADLDVAFQLGVAYFTQQEFEKAEPLFRQVYSSQPQRQNLGYYLGFLEYRRQNYQEALRFLRDNVPSDDSFAQLARFYAALSLSALGLPAEAQAEVQEALRLQPVSPLTGPAERFREVLGAVVSAERKFHLDTKFAFLYDSNVPVVPNQSSDPIAQVVRNQKHASTGELGYVRFQYDALRTVEWDGSIAGSVLQTIYNSLPDYDLTNLTGMAHLAYKARLGDKPTVWGLTYQFDYFAQGFTSYSTRNTVTGAMTVVWDAINLSQLLGWYQYTDYLNQHPVTPADNQDGYDYMIGLSHTFRFAGGQHYLRLGYQYDHEVAKGSNWTYWGNRFLVGFQYTLPWWGLRLRNDFDIHLRYYSNPYGCPPLCLAPPTYRNDQELVNVLSVAKDFPGNLTVAVEYLLDRTFSNVPLYDFTRNVISLSVSWRY